jgi:hypothetical protein
MNDITIRFLETYEYLKKEKIVYTPKGFANEISVSTSLITEICKKRTNAGITPIRNLLERFKNIDGNWLLTGVGSMLKNDSNSESLELAPDSMHYKDLADARLEIIEGLKYKIVDLEKKVEELKEIRHLSALYSNVAEPAPELIEKSRK